KLGRPSHVVPGDALIDGASMQAYTKEPYTIVSHRSCNILPLTRMLAAVRRAYPDVHARPPCGLDAWGDVKLFTNAERDLIDMQARTIPAYCVSQTSNRLYRLLPTLLLSDNVADFVSTHCAGVTSYLTWHLTQVGQMQLDMQEECVCRETERTRTLGSGVAREVVGLKLKPNASEPTKPEFSSWFGSASSVLGASRLVQQDFYPEELDPLSSDDDEDDAELSASQMQQFEAENAEAPELVFHLTRQTEISDQLYENAIATSEMVKKGNIQLREARHRARDGRKWLLAFLIGASCSCTIIKHCNHDP
ncbi:hypothetical protein B0F90DRAFT_1751853, partial [Multifurca ochricompacta]